MATSRASISLDHVLVLAHGPSNVLLRACKWASSLGADSISVVAATAPGVGALRRLKAGVEVAPKGSLGERRTISGVVAGACGSTSVSADGPDHERVLGWRVA